MSLWASVMSVFHVLCVLFVLYVLCVLYDWWKRRPWVDGLHRKAVLITGCDTGFGRAAAKSLYGRGVYVYAGCYTEAGATTLKQHGGDRLNTIIMDVSDADSIHRAYQYVKDSLPAGIELWGVVNNAGVPGHAGPLEFLTKRDFMSVLEVNVLGMIEVTNTFLPLLKKSKGRVVNVASMAAEFAFPSMMPYCVSKHAAKGFSETLRLEKVVWGIKVSTIEPAFYRTNIVNTEEFAKRLRQKWAEVDPTIKEEYGEGFVEEGIKLNGKIAEGSAVANLGQVVDCYEHALFSIHPRGIYHPGLQAKILMWLKLLPPFFLDKLSEVYAIKPAVLRS